jgi:replicative DNA helicase
VAKKSHSETIPPSAPEIEAAVLGVILFDGRHFEDAKAILQTGESFYDPRHRTVFSAMESIASQNMPIDLFTVIQRLREQEQIEVVPEYFLTELTGRVTTATCRGWISKHQYCAAKGGREYPQPRITMSP